MKSSTCPPKVFCATLLQPARMRPAPCPPPNPTRPAIESKIKIALCLSLPNQNSKITNGLCVFSRSPPNRTQPAAESKIQASQSPIKNQNSKIFMFLLKPSIESDSQLKKRFMKHQVDWIIAERPIHKQGKQAIAIAEKS